MSWIPEGWEADRRSGYGEVHHLTHTPCGWTTSNAYDLVLDGSAFGRRQAQQVVWNHICNEEI